MHRRALRRLGIAGLVVLVLQAACSKDSVEEARKRQAGSSGGGAAPTPDMAAPQGGMPDGAGNSPHGAVPDVAGGSPHGGMPGVGGSASSDEPTDGNALPLKLTGLGSAAELQRELRELKGPDAARFERAFRLTFSSDKAKRAYREADEILTGLTAAEPKFAAAYRTLAYAKFNLNLTEPGEPIALYEKAVELDPQYGEAHYAAAFMYTMVDLEKGAAHYKKAMALGVADERNLGPNFYNHAAETH